MAEIIKVIVDLPLRKLNKEFDYLLPKNLESKIKVGQIVKVPFGRRKISAFVTKINAESELSKSKLKKIDSILYQESFFDSNLLKLFYWTSAYYHAYLAQVIKSVLPAGITEKKIKKQKTEFLKLNKKIKVEKELKKLENKAPKQYLILKYLSENQSDKLNVILDFANTSRQTAYRLIEKDLVILEKKTKKRKIEINNRLNYFDDKKPAKTKQQKSLLKKIEQENYKNSYLLTTNNNQKRYNFIIKLIEKLIKNNKNIILLIPEIEKDYIFLEQLNKYFSNNIAFLHSRLTNAEKIEQWQLIKENKVQLAVGARSAVFAPFSKLDAIIMLEENNENYKGQEHPLYHARQIAARRLKSSANLFLLESPTPSLESKFHAQNGEYQELELRAEKNQRELIIVDMKKEIEKGNLYSLSQKLQEEIKNQLKKKNKMILFLNRRGSANYLICRKCGHVIKCNKCDITLNYHKDIKKLVCHHCGLKKDMIDKCPECGSAFISQAGVGTEKVIEELKELFQDIKVKRVDSDLKKSEINKRLNLFKNDKLDILVGTSIIIKNQFYQNLNFLAVISADSALNNADFRSSENNYYLIKELKNLVKNNQKSKLLIQSYNPEHYSIKSALKDNNSFYKKELKIREAINYPPFCRLINIIISSEKEEKAAESAKKLSSFLDKYNNKFLEKLGEAPAGLKKIRNKYRWQLIIKFNSTRNREYIIQLIEKRFIVNKDDLVEIRIDVDPYQML